SPDSGLAHVAAVSFLAARATPSGGFWITLAGGAALARAGARLGARRGYGASIAAMLQSVAMIGPARLGVPLTQALSAPLLGRMEAEGRGTLSQVLVCALIRTAQNVLGAAFFIGIVTGLDAYAASYDALFTHILPLPSGSQAALVATALGLLAWSAFGSTVQVLVYRRALARWDRGARRDEAEAGAPDAAGPAVPGADTRPRRFDPRAVTIAAAVAFGLLLSSTEWQLVAAVAAWLAVASVVAARADRDVLPAGLILAAIFAASGFLFTVIGGLGLDLALRRGARAGLLVLVATWLRAAAGSEGLREVGRRSLRRLRALPAVDEAQNALDELGATPRLAAAGRALFASLRPVRKRPLPVADAVLGWVRLEADRFRAAEPTRAARVRLRPRDVALVALSAIPVAALLAGA
ncbi:MAG: hypothetical protein ACR2IN_00120, partial [Thermoleophilaceae bacterium]